MLDNKLKESRLPPIFYTGVGIAWGVLGTGWVYSSIKYADDPMSSLDGFVAAALYAVSAINLVIGWKKYKIK